MASGGIPKMKAKVDDTSIGYLIGTLGETGIIAGLATVVFLAYGAFTTFSGYNETVKTLMACFSCLPIVALLLYEGFDLFYAKERMLGFMGDSIFVNFGKKIAVFGAIFISILIVTSMYLPPSGVTPIVAFIVALYVAIPETSDDFLLPAVWIACTIPSLVYGWIDFNVWVQYQTFLFGELSKVKEIMGHVI